MISLYVAIAKNGVIGKDNGLPWRLPSDLARFKQITTGHPIIMGRKTHDSIGRALPDRTNIVISRNKEFRAEGCQTVNSLDDAIELAKKSTGGAEIFIIGGSTVYEAVLPQAKKIYLTRVNANIDGDIFFKFNAADWQQTFSEKHSKDDKNHYDYEFAILERR